MGRRSRIPIWDELRRECPVAHSDRYGGTWLPVTHEDVAEVAYDTEHFTSRSVVVSELRPGDDDLPAPIGVAPPITSDPPFHTLARRLLLPAFGPKPIKALEPYTRALCNELLDRIGDRREFDAAVDYAQDIPLRVIARMLGFPEEDADLFRHFIRLVLEDVDATAGGTPGADRRRRARRLHRRAHRGAPRRTRATTSRRSCSKPSSTARSSTPTTCAARWCC